jgi:hypothetical protein
VTAALPDIALLARVFDAHGVEYMVIGGMAARAYGATRPTSDIDLLVDWHPDNRERLAAALTELGGRERIPARTPREGPARPHPELFARRRITLWWTNAGPVDVLADVPAANGRLRNYGFFTCTAEQHTVDGVTVLVPPLVEVVGSKAHGMRAKHRQDLPEFEALLRDQS